MTNPKGHIVFDCDGTLISSMHVVFEVTRKVLEDFLKRPVEFNDVVKKFTPHLPTLYSSFGITSPQDQQTIMEYWQEKVINTDYKYDLFPGIQDLLENLLEEDYKIYVWTARDRDSTVKILTELKVLQLFEDIACGDDGKRKPDPEGLETLVGKYDPKKVIMIGDTFADIDGAKAFGATSIGVDWCTTASRESLQDSGATFLASSTLEVNDYIDRYFRERHA